MNSLLKFLFFFLILFSFSSCNQINNSPPKSNNRLQIEDISWLLGDWENKIHEGKTVESWEKLNDTIFAGKSTFIKNKDSVLLENILIVQRYKNLYYIPTVRNQNDGEAVEFKLTYYNNLKIVFENPTHDFPQKITYSKISSDSILAEISGISNGKEKTVKFPMKRN